MGYYKAHVNRKEIYIKHLTILVREIGISFLLTAWYKKYPWLVLCRTRFRGFFITVRRSSDEMGLLKSKRGSGDSFITMGYDNWKQASESCVQHEKSSIHKEAVLIHSMMK